MELLKAAAEQQLACTVVPYKPFQNSAETLPEPTGPGLGYQLHMQEREHAQLLKKRAVLAKREAELQRAGDTVKACPSRATARASLSDFNSRM